MADFLMADCFWCRQFAGICRVYNFRDSSNFMILFNVEFYIPRFYLQIFSIILL